MEKTQLLSTCFKSLNKLLDNSTDPNQWRENIIQIEKGKKSNQIIYVSFLVASNIIQDNWDLSEKVEERIFCLRQSTGYQKQLTLMVTFVNFSERFYLLKLCKNKSQKESL